VLVNTSFNVHGAPVVCTPDDAYRCFVNTGMDYLVIGNFILERTVRPLKKLERNAPLTPDQDRRLKLKENPREWQKFTASVAVLLAAATAALWKRQIISPPLLILVLIVLGLLLLACLIRPRWFRCFYRAGMARVPESAMS